MSRDDIIKRYQIRRDSRLEERMDGGEGSGNWGHVGRPGERGGSQPGGGLAFRMEKTATPKSNANYGKIAAKARNAKQSGNAEKAQKMEEKRLQASKYISRKQKVTAANKALSRANDALKKANASGDQNKITKATKQVATAQKRLGKLNTERKSAAKLIASGKFDPKASKNILLDPNRSKTTTKDNARGTKEEMDNLYAKANKRKTGNGTPPAPKKTKTTGTGSAGTNGGNASTTSNTTTPPAPPKSKWQQEHDDAIDRQKALVQSTEAEKIAAVQRAIADCGNKSSVNGGADTLYQHFQDSLRLDSAPKVLSQSEFDKESGTTLYRTINANDTTTLHDRINNSIYDKKTVYSTWSAYGTGIYAATLRRQSAGYAQSHRETAMMAFKPTKDAVIHTQSRIDKDINTIMQSGTKLGSLYKKISKMWSSDGSEALRGIHAQLHGIDAMQCSNGGTYYVIYNRSNFIASDTVSYTPKNTNMSKNAKRIKVTKDTFGA